ncbi:MULTISPECIES: ABC transporter permease [Oceanimonas]|uniref:Transport permease protein n=1 Tax=Oceanimonas doudoroffii TaxID=84158 RepID=G5CZG8_9GAMM|nr:MULTISPECIES: ABC transporter permease [Oceanimonas]AEQ39123.1 ABC-type multidrug transport system permease component [Oceanimonas doudoroffii]NHH99935.1 Inner membrane transport permease YbhS [Oceanimonas sp. MB9]OXY83462.1 ABC transporter [Oceanimonas doudoroffii]
MNLLIRLRRIQAITVKEFRQLSRDRLTFAMVIMVPLLQLLLFGYAINTKVRHIPAALVDQAQTAGSRALAARLEAGGLVVFRERLVRPADAEAAITAGRVKAALVLPVDLARRRQDERPLGQWLVDGTDPLLANALLRQAALPEISQAPGRNAPFAVTLLFNPEQRAAVNIIPGLIGVILTMTMVLFTALAVVRERERGNLEWLITTPVSPMELMIGKIVPYIFAGLVQLVLILALGVALFDVPINGSPLQLLLATLLFIAASLVLGLVISTLARNQLQAMQMTVFVLMPSILLSGFMFPYEGMPVAAQWLAEGLPATHYMRLARGILLRDASLASLAFDTLWLAGFTLLGLVVAARRFHKRLD